MLSLYTVDPVMLDGLLQDLHGKLLPKKQQSSETGILPNWL